MLMMFYLLGSAAVLKGREEHSAGLVAISCALIVGGAYYTAKWISLIRKRAR
jgi:hypothetical protein